MLKSISSITNAIGALNFVGTWNASTNTPTIVSSVGVKGDYFVVSVAGSTTIDGISNWGVGDWIAYNGNIWQRVEGGADLNGVNLTVSNTTTLSGLTASTALALDATKNVVSVTNTGTGNNVLATSPTLVTPALGTPASGVVTNLTGTASININGTVGATTANTGAFTTLTTSGAVTFNDAGANVDFRVEGDTDANLLFVDASADNVGIGTNSPSTKFHVAAAANTGLLVSSTDGTTFKGIVFNSNNNQFTVGTTTNHPLVFFTNNAERARIDSGGIVTMNAYGAGAATFSAAGVISSVSDETWKIKDGVPLDPDAMLKKLEPGYWFYNEEKAPIFGADRQLGFYAQNVNAAIGPEAAPTPEEGKPWGYYDRSVLTITVLSLKNALSSIEKLKAINNAQVQTIESLTARVAALEQA